MAEIRDTNGTLIGHTTNGDDGGEALGWVFMLMIGAVIFGPSLFYVCAPGIITWHLLTKIRLHPFFKIIAVFAEYIWFCYLFGRFKLFRMIALMPTSGLLVYNVFRLIHEYTDVIWAGGIAGLIAIGLFYALKFAWYFDDD